MAENGLNSQCLDKKRYATKKYAEAQAKFLSVKFNKTHRAYRCNLCDGYHLSTR